MRRQAVAIAFAAGVLGSAVGARTVVRRTEVRGHSMKPALAPGDYLITVRTGALPDRGDIVVAEHPARPGFDLVKRVIGLPGEELAINGGGVFIDGRPLIEPWASGPTLPAGRWLLGHDEVFLLGDNRPLSSDDGRTLGPLRASGVRWRVVWRYWPRSRFGPV